MPGTRRAARTLPLIGSRWRGVVRGRRAIPVAAGGAQSAARSPPRAQGSRRSARCVLRRRRPHRQRRERAERTRSPASSSDRRRSRQPARIAGVAPAVEHARPRAVAGSPAPRKMPTFATDVAMPECSGRFTSLAIVHVSVKPGMSSPMTKHHASVAAGGQSTRRDPRQPRERVAEACRRASRRAGCRAGRTAGRSRATRRRRRAATRLACSRRERARACRTRLHEPGHGPQARRRRGSCRPTPTLTTKLGHVARIARARRASAARPVDSLRGRCVSGAHRREAAVLAAGRARTSQRRDGERERTPARAPTNTDAPRRRCATIHASGAPAMTAPRLPANIVMPLQRREAPLAGNQTALILRIAMNATDTPMPTSVRPGRGEFATPGASANSSEPAPATSEPPARMPPRPQRVGEHADRYLQQRVDVEVGRGERAERRRRRCRRRCVSSPAIAAGAVRWTNDST